MQRPAFPSQARCERVEEDDDGRRRYDDEPRIRSIAGSNFQFDETVRPESYYYSRYPMTWGWATWRRAWESHDPEMEAWPELRDSGWLRGQLRDANAVAYWSFIFEKTYRNRDAWDYAWVLSSWRAGALHAIWGCNNGMCQFQGCQPGYFDLNGDQKCEYACTFISAVEACNGVDDNCNGQIDQNAPKHSPVQICGVNPSAVSTECTTGVQVNCVSGGWTCTFPAGVCPGGCSSNDEICDNLDNDCDGITNGNVANWGKPCASDDGLAPPGHGACRTTGTFVCNGTSATHPSQPQARGKKQAYRRMAVARAAGQTRGRPTA